jgi:hypothetical protein
MWGSAESAYLLPEAPGPGDLLPTNTAVFSSSVRLGRLWHGIAAAAVFVLLLFLGIAVSGGVTSPAPWLGVAFGVPAALGVALAVLAVRRRREYAPALRIYYLDAAARPGVVTVPAGSLADPPRKVADYINALKAAVSANGGGGGAV